MKLIWIPYIGPYIAAIITYVILKILQNKNKLQRFDKYLWSPFVIAFGLVFVMFFTVMLYVDKGKFFIIFNELLNFNLNSFKDLTQLLIVFVYFGIAMYQFLWVAVFFQALAVFKNKKIYLNIAIFFVLISIFFPIFSEIFIGNIS